MPLTYLIDYCNSRIRQGEPHFLPENPIVERKGRVVARFATLRLTSTFQPVLSALHPRLVMGHEALLRGYTGDGRALAPRTLLAAPMRSRVIVHLDRLCRMVHMLNYLRQADTVPGYLFLNVSTEHLLNVPHNHGWYFEEVLRRCGLTPAHIIIDVHSSAIQGAHAAQVVAAIANYRARGYRVAIEDFEPDQGDPDRLWRLFPDIVKLDCRHLLKHQGGLFRWVELFRHAGGEIIVTRVETEVQARIAYAMGVDGLQGRYFGNAEASLRHRLISPDPESSRSGQMRPLARPASRLQYCW